MGEPAWVLLTFPSLELFANYFFVHFLVGHEVVNCCKLVSTLKADPGSRCNLDMVERAMVTKSTIWKVSTGCIGEVFFFSVYYNVLLIYKCVRAEAAFQRRGYFMVQLHMIVHL